MTSAPADILIFMTAQDANEATCYSLSERIEQLVSTTNQAFPKLLGSFHISQLPGDLQPKILEKAENGA